MLLLGYPPEFRENDFVVNTISSFGRVISWIDDERHLARILVRARVIDYESIPRFLVITEGEGFQGESWTVQCEVLQGNLLGGLPQDEDPAPGPDDFPPGGPFDLFGFGQPGNGRPFHQNHQMGPNPDNGIPGHGFIVQQNEAAQADGNGAPDDLLVDLGLLVVPVFNLNEEPINPPVLDLNVPADMQEMVIDPVDQNPNPQEMFLELNDLLNQVNEHEEDEQMADADINPIQEELANLINNPADVEVNIPVLNGSPIDVLPLEIQEENLMNDEEIQQQLEEEAAQENFIGAQNIHVGFALVNAVPTVPLPQLKPELFDSPLGPWAKFFGPKTVGPSPPVLVPVDWAKFFAALLLSPMHFVKAKEILKSSALLSCINQGSKIALSLPSKCHVQKAPSCILTEIEPDVSEVDASEAP